jgi:rubrerythrin
MGKSIVSRHWEGGTMTEGSALGAVRTGDFVEFYAAGKPAVGEFRCSECGYGIVVQRLLPSCPMCGGAAWERPTWSLRLSSSG